MALGLGDFAGQLTADQLSRAYAMAGGQPDELALDAQLQASQAPAQAPAPVERSAAATPAMFGPQATPETPQPFDAMAMQAPGGAPGRAIRELDRQQMEDVNAKLANIGQGGEEQARIFEERAGVRGEQKERAAANVAQARADLEKRRAHEDKYQQEADRLFDQMKMSAGPPPPSTIEKVLGIVGAVATIGGKSGAAQGAAMLSRALGSDPGRWEAERGAQSDLYKNALGMVQSDRGGAEHDLEVAQKFTALEAHEIDAALDQLAETSKSAQFRNAARDTQLDFRMHVRSGLRQMEVAKQKAAAAAAGGADEKRLRAFFNSLPYNELIAMPQKDLGEIGNQVISERTKLEQGKKNLFAEPEGKAGEKRVAVGQLVPGGRRVADPELYGMVEKPTLTKYVDGEDKAKRALSNIDELAKLVEEHGTETIPGATKRRMEQLGRLIQLDVKDAGELGTLDKGSEVYLKDIVGDPTAWNFGLGNLVEGVDTKLRGLQQTMRHQMESRAKSLGLQYDPGALGESSPAGGGVGPGGNPLVRSGWSAPSAASRGVSPSELPSPSATLDSVRAHYQQQDRDDALREATQAELAAFMRR